MLELTQAHKDKLNADLQQVIHDAEEVLKVMAGQTGQEAEKLRSRMESRLQQARQDVKRLQLQATEQVRHACRSTDEFVHDHPWAAAGAAAGLGLLMGMLVTRR
jgi:ElaB/YqjD/DUF883 family membrane-anchored ribosome-binding protein